MRTNEGPEARESPKKRTTIGLSTQQNSFWSRKILSNIKPILAHIYHRI